MSSFNLKRTLPLLFAAALATGASAQVELPKCETARVYGDTARLSVMKYVGTMEEAQALSKKTKKPIFFNCYVSWATTCVAMDQYVFSNQAFAKTMDKKFVNLIVDMRSKEGRELAKKYGVRSYAYYLVLDAQGNVLQRIQGGSKLPDFLQNLELALSPKTSLAGTEAKYKSGKYSRQELFNYLNALRVAGLDSTWRAVAPEYMKEMAWADYAKKGNWMFTSVYRNRNNEFYPYFLNNKKAFLANNELLQVNNKFESMLTPALLSYACGDVAYDKADVESYRRDLHTFNMPDSCACLVLCDIADLRGQGRIADLISYMKTSGRYLDNITASAPISSRRLNSPMPRQRRKRRSSLICRKPLSAKKAPRWACACAASWSRWPMLARALRLQQERLPTSLPRPRLRAKWCSSIATPLGAVLAA